MAALSPSLTTFLHSCSSLDTLFIRDTMVVLIIFLIFPSSLFTCLFIASHVMRTDALRLHLWYIREYVISSEGGIAHFFNHALYQFSALFLRHIVSSFFLPLFFIRYFHIFYIPAILLFPHFFSVILPPTSRFFFIYAYTYYFHCLIIHIILVGFAYFIRIFILHILPLRYTEEAYFLCFLSLVYRQFFLISSFIHIQN